MSRGSRRAASAGSALRSNRRLPPAGQVFEAVGVEQRLVELPTLLVAHLDQRRVPDDLLDAAAELGARHRQSLRWTGYSAAMAPERKEEPRATGRTGSRS